MLKYIIKEKRDKNIPREDFYNICYSMEALTNKNSLGKDITKERLDLRDGVGYSYLVDIFRFTVSNLIKEIDLAQLSMEDSILFYNIAKSIVCEYQNTTWYDKKEDGTYEREYDIEYAKGIMSIEDVFISYLEAHFEIDEGIIYSMLNNENNLDKISCMKILTYNQNIDHPFKEKANRLLNEYPNIRNILYTADPTFIDVIDFNDYYLKMK